MAKALVWTLAYAWTSALMLLSLLLMAGGVGTYQ